MIKLTSRVIIRYILLICLLVEFSSTAFSQTHIPRTVSINANVKGFYEYLPVNYAASTENFPLIVYCGGAGSFGNGTTAQLARIVEEGLPYYIKNNQFPNSFTVNGQTSSFIVISPQVAAWPTPADVEAVLNYIISQGYKVDQSRIYLAGNSAGGDATWKYPNSSLIRSKRLAAIAPVCSFNNPYVDTGAVYIAAANLPVWALHSNDDQTSPVYWSQNFVNKINSYNPAIPAKITRINGVTHSNTGFAVFIPTFRDGGYNIYEWMLLYRRNYPPVANAGNNVSITLPVNSAALSGAGSSDPENSPLTYSWSKIAGPSQYSINNAAIINPLVSNLVAGSYSFQLTVTDTSGYSGRDTVIVTVTNPNPNQLPIANAGADQQITLPQNAATLNGTASADNDGAIESYLWTKIAGPAQYTLTGNATSTASVTNLRPGTYLFRLAVTDNEGGSGYDTVQVTVINPFPNQLPIANAGNDVTITLPTNAVTLTGAANDPDGLITSYAWSQASGPAAALIVTPGNVSTAFQNLVAGNYRFVLRVTDDSLAAATDTVAVTVQPAPLVTSRFIKVNLYGGTNPYNQGGWNNWNVTGSTNIISSNFSYSDGATSGVSAVLSYSQGAADNGASYGGTMCPPEVLRYTTYATAGTRTVILNGLNNALKYDLELYASRLTTGNTTVFVINGISVSVVTDNNKDNKAIFTNLTPVGGQLVININKVNTFTYLNGFTLTEKTGITQPGNQPPVARAGADQSITLPANSVTVSGATSTDPDGSISSYLWTKISGPSQFAIANATGTSTAINSLVAGNYLFELTVTDNGGATAKDTMQVLVTSIATPPGTGDSLNCGKVFTIVVLGSSTAFGTGATPIDSSWVNKYRNYIRTKHPLNNIINLATLSLNTYEVLCPTGFVPPAGQRLPDSTRNITKALSYNPDAIIINMPSNDIALGIPQQESKDNYERTMALANAANVPVWVTTTQGRNALSPAERTYLMEFRDWTYQRFGSKAIDFWTDASNSDGTIADFYSAGDGVHVNNSGHNLFYLRTAGERILDTLCIRKNLAPVARAGVDISITLPADSAQLNGTASSDADGSIVAYLWTKISGPVAYNISSATASSPKLSGLTAGIYTMELRVTDNYGATGRDTVLVTVSAPGPVPPVARAGNDQTIHLPVSTAQLNGNLSTDADGTITGYSWTKISGPVSFAIDNSTIVNPVLSNLQSGVYLMELTVTDSQGLTGKDTVSIRVNQPPVANAGTDASIILPVSAIQVNGNGSSDADGTIAGYLWTKISGPASFTISNSTIANPTLSNLTNGIYGFELRVTDNLGAIARDTILITVYPPVNVPPVARAGNDQTIHLPVSTAQLNGNLSTDADGTIAGYSWVKISGPASFAIDNSTIVNPLLSNLQTGVYLVELTVTDNLGLTGKDTVGIRVNQPPVANAGTDAAIVLPVNSLPLNGSGSSDADGTIVGYLWTKISGPSSFSISNSTIANPTLNNLANGIYGFELRVTDNLGAIARDTVLVTVYRALNTPPVANAGVDISITLPTNSVTLSGAASADANGVITAYQWTQVAGPGIATINTPNAVSTLISNLLQGTYGFELRVTDDSSATSKDTVLVTVNPVPVVTAKFIKVNLYGGTNPYNQGGWYNWNVTGVTNIISSNFTYSDGTASGVSAVLDYSQGVPDNGAAYGGAMCPPEVLRYTTYSTAGTRTMIVRGLNNALKYDLELYASRATAGNTTVFVINGISQSVLTDNNKTSKAIFTNLTPVGGQLVVNINKVNTFTYLNGFILTEKVNVTPIARQAEPPALLAGEEAPVTAAGTTASLETGKATVINPDAESFTVTVMPNPSTSDFTLHITGKSAEPVQIRIVDITGKQISVTKLNGNVTAARLGADLGSGTYFAEVTRGNSRQVVKLVRLK